MCRVLHFSWPEYLWPRRQMTFSYLLPACQVLEAKKCPNWLHSKVDEKGRVRCCVELHPGVVQQQVQLLGRQSIVFGDLRDGQQRVRLEHHVVVGDLRGGLKQGLLCRQPFGPLGAKLDDGMLEELIVVQELVDGVDTVAVDDG